MKFNCGKTREQREKEATDYWCEWRPWFAWFPVRVGPHDCRWLERVERKAEWVGYACGMIYEFTPYDFAYRATEEATTAA